MLFQNAILQKRDCRQIQNAILKKRDGSNP